jgi:hypothetical protein
VWYQKLKKFFGRIELKYLFINRPGVPSALMVDPRPPPEPICKNLLAKAEEHKTPDPVGRS